MEVEYIGGRTPDADDREPRLVIVDHSLGISCNQLPHAVLAERRWYVGVGLVTPERLTQPTLRAMESAVLALGKDGGKRVALGRRARDFYERCQHPSVVAADYDAFLRYPVAQAKREPAG